MHTETCDLGGEDSCSSNKQSGGIESLLGPQIRKDEGDENRSKTAKERPDEAEWRAGIG